MAQINPLCVLDCCALKMVRKISWINVVKPFLCIDFEVSYSSSPTPMIH